MLNNKLRRTIAVSGLLLVLIVLEAPALEGQAVSIASVTGRVTDEQGALVNAAQIKMIGLDTGVAYNAATNSDGIYTFPSLPIGAYTLEATVPGFQTYLQRGILLRVNDQVQINITMKVGAVTESVEVQANAEMVQTQQNTISQVVDQQRIVDLPLNGRDPTQLITISGASINHSDGTNTGSKSFFSSQSISIAGSAGNATNYLLDGGDNNDSFTNVNMPFPFPDALAEFSVETSTLPARNGLHPGGVVNVVTKSGSNRWHGDLFEFHPQWGCQCDQLFRAEAGQSEEEPVRGHVRRQDHPGQTILLRRFSAIRYSPGPVVSIAYVPTPAALAGDFSTLDGAGCQAKGVPRAVNDPTTGVPLPNDQISPTRFDPVSLQSCQIPAPDVGCLRPGHLRYPRTIQ